MVRLEGRGSYLEPFAQLADDLLALLLLLAEALLLRSEEFLVAAFSVFQTLGRTNAKGG